MRRMHLSKQSYDFQLHQQHGTILFNLANTTLARYSASRILLRRSTPIKDIYALLRMSQHLDEPWRSRAQKQMQNIIRKRLETIPPRPCPFVIPFLCLPDFRTRLEMVLLDTIRRNHAVLLPLHWPTKKVVEGKHICLQNHVQNWRHWMAVMTWQSQPVCTCENFHDRVPSDCLFQGHIACPLSLLDLPDELENLATSHSEETFFPAKEKYRQILRTQAACWSSLLFSAVWPALDNWLDSIWPQHQENVSSLGKHNFKLVVLLKKAIDGLLVHCEDHHPNKLVVFCPVLYFTMLRKTFFDVLVFRKLAIPVTTLAVKLRSLVPGWIQQNYKWGINFDRPLPHAYILPKSKKEWAGGRPIISYYTTCFGLLFKVIGQVVLSVMTVTYPRVLGLATVQGIYADIKVFLKTHDVSMCLLYNDDLKGFFTSVPHDHILEAATHMISLHLQAQPSLVAYLDIVISVDLKAPSSARVIRGRTVQAPKRTPSS